MKTTQAQRNAKTKWRKKRPDHYWDWKLRRLYGITREEYTNMTVLQGGLCAICERSAKLQVDHKHGGDVRALLCGNCNKGIGLFGDDPKLTLRATQYLDNHSGQQGT